MTRLLLDTNVLVLLIIGRVDRLQITRHKASNAYSIKDYEKLEQLVAGQSDLATTAHIATEASNLLNWGRADLRRAMLTGLKSFLALAHEINVPSIRGANRPIFLRLGLADSVIEDVSVQIPSIAVITADGPLHNELVGHGFNSLNFARVLEDC